MTTPAAACLWPRTCGWRAAARAERTRLEVRDGALVLQEGERCTVLVAADEPRTCTWLPAAEAVADRPWSGDHGWWVVSTPDRRWFVRVSDWLPAPGPPGPASLQADEAASTGATDLYLLAERVADVPVTASFTVTPLSLGLDAEQLSATDWRDVLEEGGEVADLGGIGAVRTVGRTGVAREVVLRALGPAPEGADDPGPEEAVPDAAVAGDVESVRVDYLVPVPGASGDALLLVFGTPSGPLAPALVEVFDALATTLRFHDAVPARDAT